MVTVQVALPAWEEGAYSIMIKKRKAVIMAVLDTILALQLADDGFTSTVEANTILISFDNAKDAIRFKLSFIV